MGEIRSAWEKAMEKAEKLGKLTEEELKSLEFVPAGNALAARYISEPGFDLDAELVKYKGSGVRKYILKGVQEILLRNIVLPRSNRDKETSKKSMEGFRLIKQNKGRLEPIFERINNLLGYYEQARQQTYAQFRQNFESKMKEASRNIQVRAANQNLQPELHPQFQEEWRRIGGQLDDKYEKVLQEHKQQILELA